MDGSKMGSMVNPGSMGARVPERISGMQERVGTQRGKMEERWLLKVSRCGSSVIDSL